MHWLVRAIRQETNLQVEPAAALASCSTTRIERIPVLFIDGRRRQATAWTLANYLLAGGFFVGNLRCQMEDDLRSHGELDGGRPCSWRNWTGTTPCSIVSTTCGERRAAGKPVRLRGSRIPRPGNGRWLSRDTSSRDGWRACRRTRP